MNIFETFVTKSNSLEQVLIKIREQEVPDTFNQEFLEGMGITKPNSIHYVILFKKLGFIDDNGKPVLKYYSKFVESGEESRAIMAERIKEAYSSVFEQDPQVYKLADAKIHALFRKVMGEEKSSTFVQLVSDTFIALAKYADWNAISSHAEAKQATEEMEVQLNDELEIIDTQVDTSIAETDEIMTSDEQQTEEIFAITEMEDAQEQSTETESFEVEEDIAEWFKKPASPHEEFIMELMNGNSDHKYRDEIWETAAVGHSQFNSSYMNGNGTHAIALDNQVNKVQSQDSPDQRNNSNEDVPSVISYATDKNEEMESSTDDIEDVKEQEENTSEVISRNEQPETNPTPSVEASASDHFDEEAEEKVQKSDSIENEEADEAVEPVANANNKKELSTNTDKTGEPTMQTILQAKKSTNSKDNKVTYYSEYLKDALLKRANLLTDLGRFEEALNAYDEIIRYASTDINVKQEEIATAIYKKASILEKLNKFDEAVETYDNLIQQYFDRVPAAGNDK